MYSRLWPKLVSVPPGDHARILELIDYGILKGEDFQACLNNAIQYARIDLVELLISRDASVDKTGEPDRFTPVQMAAWYKREEVVRMLLDKGYSVNVSRGGSTALYEAVYRGSMKIAEMLLKCEALEDKENYYHGRTLLALAIAQDNIHMARLLIENGANVNAVSCIYTYKCFLPLHFAATKADKDFLELLLENGALVDARAANMWTPLHVAVDHEMIEGVQVLLNTHADINARTTHSETPLHIAVQKCKKSMVELLLKAGAYVNARAEGSATPLHLAVFRGSNDIVKLLLENGADAYANDDYFYTPLLIASKMNREDLVECLFRYSVDIDTVSDDYRTPLNIAVENHPMEVAEYMFRNGANANAHPEDFRTPLHVAVESRSQTKGIVDFLLNSKANANAKLTNSDTLLHLAIRNNRWDVVQLLLERSSDVGAGRDCNSPLCFAIQNELPAGILMEIPKYDPEVSNKSNQNALSIATRRRKLDEEEILTKILTEKYGFPICKSKDMQVSSVVSFVVRNGLVNIAQDIFEHCANVTFEFDLTPLHLASFHKQFEIAEMLLDYGADVNAQASERRTPIYFAVANLDLDMFSLFLNRRALVIDTPELLHLAAKRGSLDIVKFLLDHGFEVDLRDEMGRTALHWTNFSVKPETKARFFYQLLLKVNVRSSDNLKSHRRIAEYLLLNGADVNAVDNNRDMPLHIAAREGSNGVAQVLLKHGANVNSHDGFGDTALHSSVRCQNLGLTQLLLKAGAKADSKNGLVTPLHIATEAGDVKHVTLLLNSGANVNATCKNGTALHIATAKQNLCLVELLLDSCADINAECEQGTALHISALTGTDGWCITETLLKNGADINITNKMNETPLETVGMTIDQDSPLYYHLMKLMVGDLDLSESNRQFFKTYFMLNCYDHNNMNIITKIVNMLDEIEVMGLVKIGHFKITYLDFLRKSAVEVVSLLGIKTISESLNCASQCSEHEFPIYSSIIMNRVKYGERRRAMEEECRWVFFYKYVIVLPDLCINEILAYLSDKDLEMFLLACRDGVVN